MTGPASAAGIHAGAPPSPESELVAHLKKYGTSSRITLARMRKTSATTTRDFRSGRSEGHIYGQRFARVRNMDPESAETVFCCNFIALTGVSELVLVILAARDGACDKPVHGRRHPNRSGLLFLRIFTAVK